MTAVTVKSYEDAVRNSKLVDAKALDRVLTSLKLEFGEIPNDPGVLGERLVEQKLLTPWQNQVLLDGQQDTLIEGRHKGFFLGSYKLLGHLGTGGMNSVLLAEHVVMKRQAAIKVLPLTGDEDSAFLERFQRESQATAALDHPNIVRAHDFGTQGMVHYLVMEFVDGKDLQRVVKDRGPVPFDEAAEFIRQAALGVQHAHEAHMVHRDIKPANLLVDNKGVVKLLDLGVARVNTKDEASLTREHKENILGTADYLAPEQALDSHNVDARADIYSLGCTMYFLLTGHPPFPHGSLAQRMLMHQIQQPASIYEDRPDAPAELVAICEKMMSKKSADRYQTAAEVAEILSNWLGVRSGGSGSGSNIGIGGGRKTVSGSNDTVTGYDPATLLGLNRPSATSNADMVSAAAAASDETVNCRTCHTSFSRRLHRSRCPKCGTMSEAAGGAPSHGGGGNIRESGNLGLGLPGFGAPSNSSSGSGLGGGGGYAPADPAPPVGFPGSVASHAPGTSGSGIGLGTGFSMGGGSSGSGSNLGAKSGGSGLGLGTGGPPGGSGAGQNPQSAFGGFQTNSGSSISGMPAMAQQPAQPATARPVPKAEGVVKASCPACGATYSAPWKTCFHCGGATVMGELTGGAASEGTAAAAGLPGNRRSGYYPAATPENAALDPALSGGYTPTPSQAEHSAPLVLRRPGSMAEHARPSQAEHNYQPSSSQAEHSRPPSFHESNQGGGGTAWADNDVDQADLSEYQHQPSASEASMRASGSEASTTTVVAPTTITRPKRKPRSMLVPVLVGVLALAGLGVAGAVVVTQGAATDPNTPTYDNGQKQYTGLKSDGKQVGRWIYWSRDGQKTEEGDYRDGKKVGRWRQWSDEGQLTGEGEYVDGEKQGAWIERYPSGEKMAEGEYRQGKKQGRWTLWHRSGFRKAEGDYIEDKQAGKWTEYQDLFPEAGEPPTGTPAPVSPSGDPAPPAPPGKTPDGKSPDAK